MMRSSPRTRPSNNVWLSLLIFLLFLAAWEVSAQLGWISYLFFPAPSRIVKSIVSLTVEGKMLSHLLSTLLRLGTGFLCGAVPGLFLGLFMGWSPRLRQVVDPFIAALHPIPKVALFPIIMIIFGIGEASKIVSVAIAVFFPILISSMAGVRQLNPVYFEVTKNFGASKWRTLTRVIVPGSLPTILSGIRIAINLAMVISITVEVLAATKGLGVIIWFAWQTMRIDELYAALVVTAILGIVINLVLFKISAKLVPWAAPPQEETV